MRRARVIGHSSASGSRRWRRGFAPAFAIVSMLVASFAGAAAAEKTGTSADRMLCVHGVESRWLNVRSGPGLDRPQIGKFAHNACGLRLDGRCENGWCEMQGPGARGWVLTKYVGVYEVPPPRASNISASHKPKRARSSHRVVEAPPRYAVVPPTGYWMASGLLRTVIRTVTPWSGARVEAAGSCVTRVASWDTLRMRRGPGVSHREIGAIPSHACAVRPAGRCQGDWCRMSWRGRVGWVNTFYLR